MSTTTTTETVPGPASGVPWSDVPVGRTSLVRAVRVELRKMLDTRAGLWMMISLGGISLLIVAALLIWGDASDQSFESLVASTLLPLSILLPVLGIMAATQEWAHRTGLVTFTLEPRRIRVVVAKVIASCLLTLVTFAAALAAGAIGHAIAIGLADAPADWSFPLRELGGMVGGLLIFTLSGVAFGLLLLSTPLAIVVSLVLPTAWTILSGIFPKVADVGRWLDLTRVIEPLLMGTIHGQEWARLAAGTSVWVLLPIVIGAWRVATREVK